MRTTITVAALLLLAPTIQAADLTGCWRGHWEDCKTGHHGPLKANFTKCDDCHYKVTFTGRFMKVVPFRYSVVLNVTGQEGDRVFLSGHSNLGLFFGTFHYDAVATDTDFTADFTSRRYQGRFVLCR
ncbi:MAG: hypothetical protein HY040_03620 [Planctomycetes bacterium]|nr:hypothetical protein [Planctomycetota bacterium]